MAPARNRFQLFSHSDQVGLFQTAIANVVSQTGWSGRVADKLVGLNGSSTFPQKHFDRRHQSAADRSKHAPDSQSHDSNTTLANVLQLNMTGTNSEVASRTLAFNDLRNYDRNFTLIRQRVTRAPALCRLTRR
jgi:hypothetical protein